MPSRIEELRRYAVGWLNDFGISHTYTQVLELGRHPHLEVFVLAESSALFRVEVIRYFQVCHFQHVRQWIPNRTSQSRWRR